VEVRNLNDRVSDIQMCQNCLSYGLMHYLFMNCLQNATLAPSSSRLFLYLFVFLTSCRILFWEAGSRLSSHYISLSYCILHSSNISTLASRLTWFCARLIRFVSCHALSKIRFIIILVSATSFLILLLPFCTNFFSFSSQNSSVGIPVGAILFLLQNVRPSFLLSGYRGKAQHSGCEVYHSSPPTAEVDEWVELYLYFPPYAFKAWTETFFLSFTCALHVTPITS
jgi:hypothetical protein